MSDPSRTSGAAPAPPGEPEARSDWKVVLQFFLVPLSLVLVLVSVFFGLQIMRRHRPDTASALRSLRSYEGFMARYVGDVKRWQSGYDLSLLMRGEDPQTFRGMLPDLESAFRQAGDRGDLKLRRYLTLAFGHSGDARALAPLREALADADPETRLYACWGLMSIQDPSAPGDLRRAALDPDPGVRKMAVFALGKLGDRDSIEALRAGLSDPIEDVRWNAALALARLGDPSGAPILSGLLQASIAPGDPNTAGERRDRALNAIRGLALLRSPVATGALEAASAGAGDPEVKAAAVLALEANRPGSASGGAP